MSLEREYEQRDSISTMDIYRELALRSGVDQATLKKIFADFYDIVAESMATSQAEKVSLSFDRALTFTRTLKRGDAKKDENGNLVVTPDSMKVTVKMGKKIKSRFVDLVRYYREVT